MVYLFIGEDSPSKDIQLKAIRKEFLAKETEQFNLDILYAKELNLKFLQEKLLFLPVKSAKRAIVIKDAQNLKEDLKEFLLEFLKKLHKQLILILDVNHYERKDEFINSVCRFAKVYRFKEALQPDTFSLSRQINLKRPDYALRLLNQLLKNGERPERILGGLRYVYERETMGRLEARKRLKLLLNCDIDIKTGRIKPAFALEKLVINLCGLGEPFH